MRLLLALLVWLLRATLVTRGSLALENLALRQQLATYARRQKRPRLKPGERSSCAPGKEPALTRCPKCGGEVRRLIAGGTSFILKGGGWSKSSCADGSCCLPSSSRRGR
jgi:hypothetical protein